MSNQSRLNRLLAPDGCCVVSAIDHGSVNVERFLPGIEDMPSFVPKLAAANPDAIILTPGQAAILQAIPGRNKPSLILRVDTTNVYQGLDTRILFDEVIDAAVEVALRLDAAGVIGNLFFSPEQPDLYRQCIHNVFKLEGECERYGVPLLLEPRALVRTANGSYIPGGDVNAIVPLVRQAFELGADVMKVDQTDDLDDFHRVVEIAGGRPVLALGGGRVDERELLQRTETLVKQGVRGVVYGRNLYEQPDPAAMTRAVMAIVHDGKSADEAYSILKQA